MVGQVLYVGDVRGRMFAVMGTTTPAGDKAAEDLKGKDREKEGSFLADMILMRISSARVLATCCPGTKPRRSSILFD